MSKQTYTEQQVNGLLDKISELKREHDLLRIEVALLRTLLTEASLQPSTLDSRPSTSLQPSALPQP